MRLLPWWMRLGWRNTKVLFIMCGIEFPLTIAGLALFGIADPDLYRTSLWTEGSVHGWNSDPIEILYSYANYKPIQPPAPWNQFITDWNVVIVVLSMFILLAKTVMYIIHVLPPIFSTILHAVLATLYAYSISQQAGSDYSDLKHPSKFPWYLTHSCGAPVNPKLQGYCKQAKASFAITVCLCTLFFVHFLVALISAIPSKSQKADALEDAQTPRSEYQDQKWDYEMDRIPQTPRTPMFGAQQVPMTPRTVAFNTLDGTMAAARKPNKDLPLRHHISMGAETYMGAEKK